MARVIAAAAPHKKAAEATARAITAAARALFTELFNQVSLPAIADRAAVTVQTVLRRFGSKEELFAAAIRSAPARSAPTARPPLPATSRTSWHTRNAGR